MGERLDTDKVREVTICKMKAVRLLDYLISFCIGPLHPIQTDAEKMTL